MTIGFLSSISTPISHAQSGGISDLPFLDFNSDNNNKENDNLKELYNMIPGLNTKDNNDIDSKTGNKGAPEKTLNEESVNSKNNDESKISDYAVYSEDVIEDIYNTGSGNEKDTGTTATTPSILTSLG